MSRDTTGGRYPVLVTGAGGFIGSHVCEALLRRGNPVIAMDILADNYSVEQKKQNLARVAETAVAVRSASAGAGSHRRSEAENLVVVRGDVCSAEDLDRAFAAATRLLEGTPVRRVIHLAAKPGVRAALEESVDYVQTNVVGTTQVLEACRRHRLAVEPGVGGSAAGECDDLPGHVVIASSSTVYGNGPEGWQGPFSEEMAGDRPTSVYGASKRSAEIVARVYSHLTGMAITCVRLFGVIGPRVRGDLSLSQFTEAIRTGRPIKQYGDGSSARDYTYVGDIATGILLALDRIERARAGLVEMGDRFECVNLGNNHPITLREYLGHLERLMETKAIVEEVPPHPMDAQRTWADLSKARRLLGYEPRVGFEEALQLFLEWYRESAPPSRS